MMLSGGAIKFELAPTQILSDLIDNSGQLSGTGDPYLFDLVDAGAIVGATYNLMEFSNSTIAVTNFAPSIGSGFAGNFAYSGGNTLQFTVTTVPEPSTYALLRAAGAALYCWRRRRSARAGKED